MAMHNLHLTLPLNSTLPLFLSLCGSFARVLLTGDHRATCFHFIPMFRQERERTWQSACAWRNCSENCSRINCAKAWNKQRTYAHLSLPAQHHSQLFSPEHSCHQTSLRTASRHDSVARRSELTRSLAHSQNLRFGMRLDSAWME